MTFHIRFNFVRTKVCTHARRYLHTLTHHYSGTPQHTHTIFYTNTRKNTQTCRGKAGGKAGNNISYGSNSVSREELGQWNGIACCQRGEIVTLLVRIENGDLVSITSKMLFEPCQRNLQS